MANKKKSKSASTSNINSKNIAVAVFAVLIATIAGLLLYLIMNSMMAGRGLLGYTDNCIGTDKAQIAGLFDRWNSSLKTKDPDQVLSNYDSEAILLPTLSAEALLTQGSRREYFVDFLSKGPSGTIDSRQISIHCNTATDTGLYTFSFKDGSTASARYTFVYEYYKGQWLIISHHSSLQPN